MAQQTAIPPEQFYGSSTSNIRPSTPPTIDKNPPIQDTPTHERIASLLPYSSSGGQFMEPAFVEAAKELKDKFVLVAPDKFLAHYLPEHPPNMPTIDYSTFRAVTHKRKIKEVGAKKEVWVKRKKEKYMYEPMITALAPFLKKGWKMVNTSSSPDPNSAFFMDHQAKPDVSAYSDKNPSNNNLCRVCDMETFIEFKLRQLADAFEDDIEKPERDFGEARDTRGQLITYLNAIQAAQHRTHTFGVLVAEGTCRLLRHTRSSIEVTTSFNYTQTSHLQTFFWRLSHAAPAVRGTDTTFEPVGRFEATQARLLLNAMNESLWRVRVGDSSFYVAAPFTRAHHYPVGRGTRCFIAVDCKTQQKCLLKDVWRVDGYHPEGEVYKRLHDNHVRNIPGILAAGDVEDHRCGFFPDGWYIPSASNIREHIHYRIVLDVVGEPLDSFESTHAMVRYVLNALEAHFDAVTLAHVEHRDISFGNIIIVRNSDGTSIAYLIDWELAKFSEDKGPRAYERTGTRQFMSARLCSETPPPRTVGDDLESFALLLLWLACRYAANDMSPTKRATFLRQFDHVDDDPKANMFRSGITIASTLKLPSEHLAALLEDLIVGFSWRYKILGIRESQDKSLVEELKHRQGLLESHQWLMDLIGNALKDEKWKAVKDPARKKQKVARLFEREGGKKRKSACSEYELTNANKRLRRGEHGPREVVNVDEEDDEEDSDDEEDDDKEGDDDEIA